MPNTTTAKSHSNTAKIDGDNTAIHPHEMNPVSLRTMKTIVKIPKKPILMTIYLFLVVLFLPDMLQFFGGNPRP